MTTAGVARRSGYSTQQVRDLERLGALPAAARAANGYRRYDRRHLAAVLAYRELAVAVGPVSARRLAPQLVGGPIEDAAELIDELHATLARDRVGVREALRGLDAVLADSSGVFDEGDIMAIGELARALGIRPSALRHWEHERLVHPDRAGISGVRAYGARAIAQARIVAALRAGGYGIPRIRAVLDQLSTHGLTADARRILEGRLEDLARRSIALLAAAGHLHDLLRPAPPATA